MLLAILAGAGAGIGIGWAAPDVPSSASPTSPSAETFTIPLADQEVAYSVINLGLTVTDQPHAFKKEPQSSQAKVRRGRLDFQIPNEPALPFLWDYGQGKLYLDLNRNEDLTDDPAGVFSSATAFFGSSSYRSSGFTNVHLTLPTKTGPQSWLVDLNFFEYRSQVNGHAAVRSFWAGKAVLAGREWQVGLIDIPRNRQASAGGGHLLLRPWENRNNAFSVYDGSLDAAPFSGKLFIQARLYDVECAQLGESDPPRRELKLREQPAELGELKLTGDFIQRVHLTGGPCLAVLDAPTGTVRVPVGQYGDFQVRLGQGGVVAHSERSDRGVKKPLVVAKDKVATLVAGGPLTNSVTLTRRGRHLVFNYRLLGAGGETYQLETTDRSNPPQFAVYQGDKKIASGRFEFG